MPAEDVALLTECNFRSLSRFSFSLYHDRTSINVISLFNYFRRLGYWLVALQFNLAKKQGPSTTFRQMVVSPYQPHFHLQCQLTLGIEIQTKYVQNNTIQW